MAATIERTLASALRQDYDNLEVLVVDNQSTDGTFEIANAHHDGRLRVLRNGRNLGAYGNHNRCLELARGEWIKFLHGDDELLPQCVSRLMQVIDSRREQMGLLACGAIQLDQSDSESGRTVVPPELVIMKPAPMTSLMLEGNIFGTPSMVLVHRDRLLAIGGFDTAMEPTADGDCWFNLRRHYHSGYAPEYLVMTRDDPPESTRKEAHLAGRFAESMFRQIEKWHRLDEDLSSLRLKDTAYGEWMKRESFRFFTSGIRFASKGEISVLRIMCAGLWKHGLLGRSAGFFVRLVIRGKRPHQIREFPWYVSLKEIFS